MEFIFQDQYLGRSDMWRLGEYLVGQCVYTDQDVAFVGGIAAKIQTIYVDSKKVTIFCRLKHIMLIILPAGLCSVHNLGHQDHLPLAVC